MNTTAAAQFTTSLLSDGRVIFVEDLGGTFGIVMRQTDGSETGICVMQTLDSATTEAQSIARGIEADLRWFAK